MSWLERIVGLEDRGNDYSGPLTLQSAFGGMFDERETDAGVPVSPESSLRLSAVFACVRVLAEAVSSLPLPVYQRRGRSRERAYRESAYRLLHDRPNPEMTPMDLWSLEMVHLNLHGDGFLGKEFVSARSSTVRALWPIDPDAVIVRREKGEKGFYIGGKRYTTREIIHIRGLSLDGLVGMSPIGVARNAIGTGLALNRLNAALLRDRAVPQGVVTIKEKLVDQTARQRFRAEWDAILKSRGRVAILDNGAQYEGITMPLGDVQFIEQQQFGVQEIARIFNVPVSRINGKAGDSLTYRTVESDTLHFQQSSVRPWLVRIEQALRADLDLFPDPHVLYPEFLADAMLRTDTLTRARANALATSGAPWKTGAEVRAEENLAEDDRFDVVAEAKAPADNPDVPTDTIPTADEASDD